MDTIITLFVLFMIFRAVIRRANRGKKPAKEKTHRPRPVYNQKTGQWEFPREAAEPAEAPPESAFAPYTEGDPDGEHAHVEYVPTEAESFAGEGDPETYHSRRVDCETAQHKPGTEPHRHIEYVPHQGEGFAGEGDAATYELREVSCATIGHDPEPEPKPIPRLDRDSLLSALIYGEVLGKPKALR